MLSIVYVSSAAQEFSEADLIALLEKSRKNNASLDITGMLLYKDGNFIQVLEGPDNAVRQLFDKICKDERHCGVIRLLEHNTGLEQNTGRQFPDWSMGFQNLKDPAIRELPGYSEFLNESFAAESFRGDPGKAVRLLDVFRRNMTGANRRL